PAGYVANSTDCNDNNAAINPGATDIPNNSIDEDCNGSDASTVVDNDGDGSDNTVDCNDNNNTIYPGATELCDNLDNDCDGQIDEGTSCSQINYYCDKDNDGFIGKIIDGTCNQYNCVPNNCNQNTGNDCNDNNININPNKIESCDNDSLDNDCDGQIDECSCNNGIKDSDETDIDCGGTCGSCPIGKTCSSATDCLSGLCLSGTCSENVDCKEVSPGHNDAGADRVNIVFVGLSYTDKNKFISDIEKMVDLNQSLPGIGLAELEVYKNNMDKFNFWFIDNIFTPIGDPSSSCTSCSNPESNNFCTNLPNKYVANVCDTSFRPCAYFGGTSYNTVRYYSQPTYSFMHEFQHQFPGLADEYTEGTSNRPRAPNCAPDLTTAQSWWSDLEGQNKDGLTIGYNSGCSYISGNYRPTSTSIMKAAHEYRLGLVNEREIQTKLDTFSGTASGIANGLEITIEGNPENISSYKVVSIEEKTSIGQQIKNNEKYKIKVKGGPNLFFQTFDTYDYLAIDGLTNNTLSGEIIKEPKKTIKINIPIGK
ncbi:MAG: hypothetical protein KC589_07420, partial [Nanoarchaeota archaeon]|nr:hypothetical protein [Nanoarchaeota archaeon]